MKKSVIILLSILLLVFVFSFSSCKDEAGEDETTTNYAYTPGGQAGTTVSGDSAEAAKQEIQVNKSWQKNFTAEYEYYNPEQSPSTMRIKEKKSQNAFTVEYLDTKSVLYYKANGNDTDYYVLIENQEEQAYSVLENKPFSSLSSMFMKLTELAPELPTLSNVLYMYDEEVAGRPCRKYIQRAYSDGKLTQSVYVWVDIEFGFAAKCEAYNESNMMTVMWRLTSFETGTLKDEDVFIDVSGYNFGGFTVG